MLNRTRVTVQSFHMPLQPFVLTLQLLHLLLQGPRFFPLVRESG